MNAIKGWKTLGFNAANLLTVLVPIITLEEWKEVIPAEYMAYWLLFVTLMNLWLRMVTTTPVGKKGNG